MIGAKFTRVVVLRKISSQLKHWWDPVFPGCGDCMFPLPYFVQVCFPELISSPIHSHTAECNSSQISCFQLHVNAVISINCILITTSLSTHSNAKAVSAQICILCLNILNVFLYLYICNKLLRGILLASISGFSNALCVPGLIRLISFHSSFPWHDRQ